MIIDVATYLQYSEVAQFTDASINAFTQYTKGGMTVPRYVRLVHIVRRAVQYKFDQNPTDSSLVATGDYLFALTGGRNITPTVPTSPFLIIIHPVSQTVSSGANVTFTVVVAGGTAPYTYQWYFNAAPLSGETADTLDLTSVDSGDAGGYYCIIQDSTGSSLQSNTATLTVNAGAITAQAYYGSTDYFAALSGGTDAISYQLSFNITHDAPIAVPYPLAAGNNQFLVIRVPIGESVKTTWFNTAFNSGTIIPTDFIFRVPLTPAGLPLYRYYLTQVEVSNDFSGTNKLTLS